MMYQNQNEPLQTELPPERPPENPGYYLTGFIGAMLGAAIGALPTLSVGFFGFVSGWLGILTAFASAKGYRLFHGAKSTGYAFTVVLISSTLMSVLVSILMLYSYTVTFGYTAELTVWFLLPIVFTVMGAIFSRRGIKNYTQPERLQRFAQKAAAENAEVPNRTLHYAEKGWMRPARISSIMTFVPGLIFAIAILAAATMEIYEWMFLFAALGALIGVVLVMCTIGPFLKLLQFDRWVFVRTEQGTVWRVDFPRLNTIENYRFTEKTAMVTAMCWLRLSSAEQEMGKAAISHAIADLESEKIFPGSTLSMAVIPLLDVRCEKETKWAWKISYRTEDNRRKKMTIAKAYGGFSPLPELPVPTAPVPYRWELAAAALGLIMVFTIVGGGFGATKFGGGINRKPAKSSSATINTPKSTNTYEQDGVTYQVDSAFLKSGTGVFTDPDTNVKYSISVMNGMDEDAAISKLVQLISDNRMNNKFKSFRFDQTEANLVSITAQNGAVYQYNILSIDFSDDTAKHTAVALSDAGTLLHINVQQPQKKKDDDVKSTIRYIIQSSEMPVQEQSVNTIPEQVTITDENYQSLFQPATHMGFQYLGAAYYKAPEEMFQKKAFLDAYVPYGGQLVYSDDGTSLEATAHGMRVHQTTRVSQVNAQAVVDEAFEELVNSGMNLYTEGVFDTYYVEEHDIAYKQIAFFEENGTLLRMAVLYADIKQENYYLYAQITYLPEQMDADYPALLLELRDAFGLSFPEVPPA